MISQNGSELEEDEEGSSTCSSSTASLSDESFDGESTASQDMVEPENGQIPVKLDNWGISAIFGAGYHLGKFVGPELPGRTFVRHAAHMSDFHSYAVKSCSSCGQKSFATEFDGIWSEYELLRTLVHPSIVSVAFLFYSKHDIWLFREWCTDGSLWAYVLEHGELEESHAWRLADQMVEGIHYVHGKGLVHQNLQPTNLLLTKHAQMLKIAGFSKSATTCDNDIGLQTVPTPTDTWQRLHDLAHESKAWMAPEQICFDQATKAVDIWSCGLCVGFMMLRRHPFSSKTLDSRDDLNEHTLRKAVRSMCRGKSPEVQLKCLSLGARSFLEVCLYRQPVARVCAKVLRLHPVLVPDIRQLQHPQEVFLEHFQLKVSRPSRSVPVPSRSVPSVPPKMSSEHVDSQATTVCTLPLLQPEEKEEAGDTTMRSCGRSKTWQPAVRKPKCTKTYVSN